MWVGLLYFIILIFLLKTKVEKNGKEGKNKIRMQKDSLS
jgi:hypothetical protein